MMARTIPRYASFVQEKIAFSHLVRRYRTTLSVVYSSFHQYPAIITPFSVASYPTLDPSLPQLYGSNNQYLIGLTTSGTSLGQAIDIYLQGQAFSQTVTANGVIMLPSDEGDLAGWLPRIFCLPL